MHKLLDGITVLDFTQLLSGPSAALRLSDLGARVIKVEHAEKGDLSRSIYGESLNLLGESAFFQAINRGKESITANLKDKRELQLIYKLVEASDIVINNFRPGVMKRLGLDFNTLKTINPNVVYGSISGYGTRGPWANKAGQDLLVQALSGLTWQSGTDKQKPIPMGVAIADIFAGAQLVQGILAALLADKATQVEVNMLEAMLDFQFEPLTLYYQNGKYSSTESINEAQSNVSAPNGLYRTKDGYIVLAISSLTPLVNWFKSEKFVRSTHPNIWDSEKIELNSELTRLLTTNTTKHWLTTFKNADIWCAEVFDWVSMLSHDGFKVLEMLQTVTIETGERYTTTRCPMRIDGQKYSSHVGAPLLGQHTQSIKNEFEAYNYKPY